MSLVSIIILSGCSTATSETAVTTSETAVTAKIKPSAVVVNPTANILYVANYGSNTVTYFNATTGDYINGTLAASSFTTGAIPVDLAVNSTANILYVVNNGSNTVTFFDATSGMYLNGTLVNSSFSTDTSTDARPSAIVVNPATNILYVVYDQSNLNYTVTYFNATTGAYINGSIYYSTIPAGFEIIDGYAVTASPIGATFNSAANILYIINTLGKVTFYNASNLSYLNGTYDASSFVAGSNGSGIVGVAVNPSVNILYVVNQISQTVVFFNATTGDYLY